MHGLIGMFPPHGGIAVEQLNLFRSQVPEGEMAVSVLEEILGVSLREKTPQIEKFFTDGLYSQALSMAVSCGLYSFLENKGIKPDYAIGHSLGIYSAVVSTGCLDIYDGLKLLISHLKMVQNVPGGMAIVLNYPWEETGYACSKRSDIWVSAYNGRKLNLVSGTHEALNEFDEWLDSQDGTLRRMEGYGPWHCPLASSSVFEAGREMEKLTWSDPDIPVIIPIDPVLKITTADGLIKGLLKHMSSPVLWLQNTEALLLNHNAFCMEIGISQTLHKFYKLDPHLRQRLASSPEPMLLMDLIKNKENAVIRNGNAAGNPLLIESRTA